MLSTRPKEAEANQTGCAAMTKLFAAVIATVLLGGAAILVFSVSATEARSTPMIAKGDRLDARDFGATCSQASWPYYEAGCLRNRVGTSRDAKAVRVVSTDRVR